MATQPLPKAQVTTQPRSRRRRRHTDAANLETIRRLTLSGHTGGEIAQAIGSHRSWISRIQKQLGLDVRGIQQSIRESAPPPQPKQKKLQTKFELRLPPPLARSLAEWHSGTSRIGGLDAFASEILQTAIAEFRVSSLPARAVSSEEEYEPIDLTSVDVHRTELRAAQIAKMRKLYSQGMSKANLAERFGVKASTIARALGR